MRIASSPRSDVVAGAIARQQELISFHRQQQVKTQADDAIAMLDTHYKDMKASLSLFEQNVNAWATKKDEVCCALCEEAAGKLSKTEEWLQKSRLEHNQMIISHDELLSERSAQKRELCALRAKEQALEMELRRQRPAMREMEARLNQDQVTAFGRVERANEARIEQVGALIMRGIIHRDVRFAFTSWAEICNRRSFAIGRLRLAAWRLRQDAKAKAFATWVNASIAWKMAARDASRKQRRFAKAEVAGGSGRVGS